MRTKPVAIVATVAALTLSCGVYFGARADDAHKPEVHAGAVIDPENVELAASQTESIDVATVAERVFPLHSPKIAKIEVKRTIVGQDMLLERESQVRSRAGFLDVQLVGKVVAVTEYVQV